MAIAKREDAGTEYAADVQSADEHINLNLMVAGAAGQGKSTFVNNLLFQLNKENLSIGGEATSRSEWLANPGRFRYPTNVIDCTEAGKTIQYTVQDTPGYGDGFNIEEQIFDVVNFIIAQHYKYYDQRELKHTAQADLVDTRIDACFYFIAPHRFQEIDILFLQELSRVVTIIPVIAKADSMLKSELQAHKREIWGQVQRRSSELHQNFMETEKLFVTPTTRKSLAISNEYLTDGLLTPFTVICQKSAQHKENYKGSQFWPIRKYEWGTAESFNPKHCDFFFLKKLLLEFSVRNLKKRTDQQLYERYRQNLYRRGIFGAIFGNIRQGVVSFLPAYYSKAVCEIPYHRPASHPEPEQDRPQKKRKRTAH